MNYKEEFISYLKNNQLNQCKALKTVEMQNIKIKSSRISEALEEI